jgi:hypothetical protein
VFVLQCSGGPAPSLDRTAGTYGSPPHSN